MSRVATGGCIVEDSIIHSIKRFRAHNGCSRTTGQRHIRANPTPVRAATVCLLLLAATFVVAPRASADSSLLKPATLSAKAPAHFDVLFRTTAGSFTVAVTRAWAPRGADRFYNLVKHGFFTGAAFFRVVPGFVVQFGLSPNPAVNKAWSGASIGDDPVKESNRTGFVSFASAGPNTRTTQLFINLNDNARLDGLGFAPIGKVVSGMDVVGKIYAGYREAPDQTSITAQGKGYLDKNFPKLDRITSANLIAGIPS
ncbi:MAG: peptidylprolyl isomerase, partial [Candidatus Eremiobacteraeota bacterium]|nr:peptidylprolyl isomerase [Candidatus Eremiobacteraeota bacterium]